LPIRCPFLERLHLSHMRLKVFPPADLWITVDGVDAFLVEVDCCFIFLIGMVRQSACVEVFPVLMRLVLSDNIG